MAKANYISERIPAPKIYEGVLGHFYLAENNGSEPLYKKLLPGLETYLIFNFGSPSAWNWPKQPPKSLDQCLLLGPTKQILNYTIFPQGQLLVMNFRNEGFFELFNVSPPVNTSWIDPQELLSHLNFQGLWEELRGLPSPADRINHLLAYLLPFLKSNSRPQTLRPDYTNLHFNPIKTLAAQSNKSERYIQILHKKNFGYTAKEKLRYLRFLDLVRHLDSHPDATDWAELVVLFNYFDQSQLIRDFKYYLDMTPSQYLAYRHRICASNL